MALSNLRAALAASGAAAILGFALAGCSPSNSTVNTANVVDVSSGAVASAASALAASASPSDAAAALPGGPSSQPAARSNAPASSAQGGYD